MDKANIKKKDIKVEIIRIICCFLVIFYHIRLRTYVDGEIKESAVLVEAVCSICVNTFFIISGFFIYENKNKLFDSWKHIFINFIKNIYLPFVVIAFFCFIFNDWFLNQKSFFECIKQSNIYNILYEMSVGMRYFILYSSPTKPWPVSTAHMWYVFGYSFIIIFYPITKYLLKKLNKKIFYILFLILLFVFLTFDIIIFFVRFEDNYYLNLIPKVIIFSISGDILYNQFIKKQISNTSSNLIINKKIFNISVFVYILSIILLFLVQFLYLKYVNGFYVYTSFNSFLAFIESIAFIIILYNINIEKYFNEKTTDYILKISECTYGIYLLHYIFIIIYGNYGLYAYFIKIVNGPITTILYYIIYGSFIFLSSFLIVKLYKTIKKQIINIKG